ncbi:MAG: carboxypeptidase regulatory-like domain-containing protein [Verrucomicrobia bacterium]|nr:carboxypeptidase regulatory-like domain-containing protein [Verrucomicrobiota bacterium]
MGRKKASWSTTAKENDYNNDENQWTTDFTSSNKAENKTCDGAVALHEIGHFIGLEHSPLGGATMFVRSAPGDNLQAGLSADDLAAARSLYPADTTGYGAITGRVVKDHRPVFGAAVFAHNSAGCAVAGTVTGPQGNFMLSMLPPGNYQVHAAPLDPPALNRLCAGADIAPNFSGADTKFLPTRDRPVTVAAGKTNSVDFAVANATPAFRISNIRVPTANASSCAWSSLPASLCAGQNNYTIGVASPTLPTHHATLAITGDGLTLGPPTFLTNAFQSGLNFISAAVSVSSNATPGLRTFVVQQGPNVACAHGFLEILPAR